MSALSEAGGSGSSSGARRPNMWYMPVLSLAMALMMLRLLLMARWLPVQAFADYSAGLLVANTLGMLGCLGLQPLMQRDMPILMVRGRHRRALVQFFQALLVALLLAAIAWILESTAWLAAISIAPAAVVGVLLGLSQQGFLLASTDARSRGETLRFASENLWRSLAVIAAGAAAALGTGSGVWALVAEALVSLLLSARLAMFATQRETLNARALVVIALRRMGKVPWQTACVFLGISMAAFAVSTMDRWIAATLLDKAGFALYSFAAIVLLIAQSLQAMLNASVYPSLAREFALTGRAAAYRMCVKWSVRLALIGFAVLLPAHWAAALIVSGWFPQYAEAAGPLWLLLAAAVFRVSDFWSSFLSICGYEHRLLRVHVLAAVLIPLAWLLAMRFGIQADPRPAHLAALALLLSMASWFGAAVATWRARRSP